MRPIPIAFIGGSINSAVGNTHRIAAEMDGRFKLVAGCFSRNSALNNDTGKSWGISPNRIYKDWQSLLEGEQSAVEVVVVLTPTPHHTEVLNQARSYGYAVICEKSLTTSVQSTIQLGLASDKATRDSRIHAVYNYTGYPMVREMKYKISKGEIGDLLHCDVVMPQEGFLRRHPDGSIVMPQDWRQQDEKIPTVSLDLGIHVVNLFRFVTSQRIEKLVASYQSRGNIPNVVDYVSLIADCSNQVKASFQFGKTSIGQSNGLAITCYGSQGSISWLQLDPEYLLISSTSGVTRSIHRGSSECRIAQELRYNRFKAGHPSGFIEAFSNHYFDIADDLESEKSSEYTFDQGDALIDMNVLEAISDSVATQQWVDVVR
jgi:predicted dehydrogenase